MAIHSKVTWRGREEAELTVELAADQKTIQNAKLVGIGGPNFLAALKEMRAHLKGEWQKVALPQGQQPAKLLLRELLMRARGEWKFPYAEAEVCHCRAVPTEVVDQAICQGAHTPKKVSAETSASTACGTCRPDVEAIISYRLASK